MSALALHPESGLSADEIWKLEQEKLAQQAEVNWRKRQDALTGKIRPAPERPSWHPMSAEEFYTLTGDRQTLDFTNNRDTYGEYLKGFFREVGKRDASRF